MGTETVADLTNSMASQIRNKGVNANVPNRYIRCGT